MLKTTDSLDTPGFFVYHQEDAKRILDVLRVKGADYPISDSKLTNELRQKKQSGRPWKVAFVKTHIWNNVKPYAKESLLKWVKALDKRREIEVFEVDLPKIIQQSHQIHSLIYDKSLFYYF